MVIHLRTLAQGESLYFSFHQKWSKLCTLLQKDANEVEMKKYIVQNLYKVFISNSALLKNLQS
jgi:hypothetical protein